MIQFLVFLPFFSLLVLIFILKDLLKSLVLTYFVTLIVSIYIGVYFEKIFSSHIESLFTGFRIFLLVFSILLLFKIIEKENRKLFKSFKEKDLQTFIAVGVFLTILIEGLVGFGTPGMVAVRTLYDLNFNSVLSASVSLISDFSSTFGAFSTPIIIGAKDAITFGFVKIVGIVFSVLTILTVFISTILYFKFENVKNIKIKFELILATVIFLVAMFITSQTQFFMFSIIFAPIGALLVLFIKDLGKFKNFLRVLYPFLLSIVIFIILKNLRIKEADMFLSSFNISPILLLVAFLFILKDKLFQEKDFYVNILQILKKSLKLFLLIFFLSFSSSYFLFSSYNEKNVKGVIETLRDNFSNIGIYYFLLSPLIGIFGAFIFGSATMSNLTFIKLQQEIAMASNLDVNKILALQSIGAGIGNMISLYNISAIVAMIDELKGKETEILKINSIIAICFSVVSSFLVLLL